MSLDVRNRQILCDHPQCGASVHVTLANDTQGTKSSTAKGWTFVRGSLETRHYCPNCTPAHAKSPIPAPA